MNILVYTSLYPNNIEPYRGIFIKQRTDHVAKLKNCRISVVAPVPYCPQWPSLGKWSRYSRIKRHESLGGIDVYHPRYPLIPKISMQFHGIFMFLASLPLLKRLGNTFPFDVIDSHFVYPDGFAAILLGKILNKPVVLSARGSDIHQYAELRTIRPLIQYALRNADSVISVCERLKRSMIQLGTPEGKIQVLPNGVDLTRFNPSGSFEARHRLSLEHHNPIILSVGSLIPLKGFHLVVDAMQTVIKDHPDAHLFIVGEGDYRKSLERKISQFNLQQHVTLVGSCPNNLLTDWYNAADVFCLASSREGWANVIMESLACGTPVVATDVGGNPDIIDSLHLGLLVDRTPTSIAKGLTAALERQWDSGRIRAHVASRSWDSVARKFKAIFDVTTEKFARETTPTVQDRNATRY